MVGLGGRTPPTAVIDNDTNGSVETGPTTFDPSQDGIDFWESLEGMLVQVNDGAVVNETESFGEITLLPDNGLWATGTRTREAASSPRPATPTSTRSGLQSTTRSCATRSRRGRRGRCP